MTRAREDAVTLRIDGREMLVEVAWEAIQSRPYGWRVYLICGRCGMQRHALFLVPMSGPGGTNSSLLGRCCGGLRYPCRTVGNRLPLRAAKLRRKLGAQPSLLAPLPPRPKHNTAAKRFDRIARELALIEARIAGQL